MSTKSVLRIFFLSLVRPGCISAHGAISTAYYIGENSNSVPLTLGGKLLSLLFAMVYISFAWLLAAPLGSPFPGRWFYLILNNHLSFSKLLTVTFQHLCDCGYGDLVREVYCINLTTGWRKSQRKEIEPYALRLQYTVISVYKSPTLPLLLFGAFCDNIIFSPFRCKEDVLFKETCSNW